MTAGAPSEERFTVVIAGGGAAALEALLALRALAGEAIAIEMIAPKTEFVLRPLLVGEPFGLGSSLRLDLREVTAEHNARFRRDAVLGLDPGGRRLLTESGEPQRFDAALLAIGGMPVAAVPGALTFGGAAERERFRAAVEAARAGELRRITFAVPRAAGWSLAAYELALLTAADARRAGRRPELAVATYEQAPLEALGRGSADAVAALLADAGVELLAGAAPEAFADGRLTREGAPPHETDLVVALPGIEVPPLENVPQRAHGLIPTDVRMNVEGLTAVWAAGDAIWHPIKQGGLATQQADTAAAGIAGEAGITVPRETFRPVLRAALLTGAVPLYVRGHRWGAERAEELSRRPLWWPAGKLAGRHLAPYLARTGGPLADLPPAAEPEAEEAAVALELAADAAAADAEAGDYEGALEWLEVIEQAGIALTPEQAAKRRAWQAAARD